MNKLAELRPSGTSSFACKRCVFVNTCGGLDNSRPLLDCFDLYCCHKENCDDVCPNNKDFLFRQAEVRGFHFHGLSPIEQESRQLPLYMPMIHHGYRRSRSLEVPYAIISLYDLFSLEADKLVPKYASLDDVRKNYRISPNTQIGLVGTAKDKSLERYWSHRRTSELSEYLGTLGIAFVIGPNFSSFLDVPRTDVIYNRKRQLLCLNELSEEGISVVPHLGVTMPSDWRNWISILRENPRICQVAFNFQTGYKNREQGMLAVRMLEQVQQELGRQIVPLLVGGAQFTEYCSSFFDHFSVIDSVPFAKTMRRQSMSTEFPKRRWHSGFTLFGQQLDTLLQQNVERYSSWVSKVVAIRKLQTEARLQ